MGQQWDSCRDQPTARVWLVLLLCAKFESSLSLILKLDYLVDMSSNSLFFYFCLACATRKRYEHMHLTPAKHFV